MSRFRPFPLRLSLLVGFLALLFGFLLARPDFLSRLLAKAAKKDSPGICCEVDGDSKPFVTTAKKCVKNPQNCFVPGNSDESRRQCLESCQKKIKGYCCTKPGSDTCARAGTKKAIDDCKGRGEKRYFSVKYLGSEAMTKCQETCKKAEEKGYCCIKDEDSCSRLKKDECEKKGKYFEGEGKDNGDECAAAKKNDCKDVAGFCCTIGKGGSNGSCDTKDNFTQEKCDAAHGKYFPNDEKKGMSECQAAAKKDCNMGNEWQGYCCVPPSLSGQPGECKSFQVSKNACTSQEGEFFAITYKGANNDGSKKLDQCQGSALKGCPTGTAKDKNEGKKKNQQKGKSSKSKSSGKKSKSGKGGSKKSGKGSGGKSGGKDGGKGSGGKGGGGSGGGKSGGKGGGASGGGKGGAGKSAKSKSATGKAAKSKAAKNAASKAAKTAASKATKSKAAASKAAKSKAAASKATKSKAAKTAASKAAKSKAAASKETKSKAAASKAAKSKAAASKATKSKAANANNKSGTKKTTSKPKASSKASAHSSKPSVGILCCLRRESCKKNEDYDNCLLEFDDDLLTNPEKKLSLSSSSSASSDSSGNWKEEGDKAFFMGF